MSDAEIREVLEKCVAYVRARHNASGWWNDPYAYGMIEDVLKPALAKLSSPEVGK